jgi:DNA-binding NarL/FixJ family response regulator
MGRGEPYDGDMAEDLTVLIIDENAGVGAALAQRLKSSRGITVIAHTENPTLGAELAHQLKPTVILADFRPTGPPRTETYRWLHRVAPQSQLVVLSSFYGEGEERACMEAGARKCLLKGISTGDLVGELRELSA